MAIATAGRGFAVFTLAAAAALPASADKLAGTDAAWLVTAGAPTAGWNQDAGFDTSGWQAALELYDVEPYLGPAFAGTKAIWSQGGQFSPTETTIWARQIIHVSGPLLSAELVYGFDDDADVFVNGSWVVSNHDGVAGNGWADLTPYLHAGDNLIAFVASDNWPVYGYNHAAWLQVNGEMAVVPEPASAVLLLLGLAGLAGTARRRN